MTFYFRTQVLDPLKVPDKMEVHMGRMVSHLGASASGWYEMQPNMVTLEKSALGHKSICFPVYRRETKLAR